MKKLIITSLIIFISFSSEAQSWWNSKKVKGNGKVITKTRSVDNFDEVSVGGSFDVNLIDGKEGKITIEGEENIIPYIITEVRGGTLKIKFKDNTNIRTTKRLTVTVPFEEIEGVSLGGSGNINVEKRIKANDVSFSIGGSGNITAEVDASSVKSSIGGSGNIKLKGNTGDFKCSIAGSGSVKAYDLYADNLKANIAGSGSVQTSVKTKIDANVVGSGSVYYKGKPKYIDSNSVGSGDVIDKN
ncbi:putative autotransporter adhesin-like protein [Tenacibaculum adriaticum]|uniref:Putative autotransporter adhesin-like protein n=1 Tax=Tenacibaculum adriaticum TaxID=413713 RepID=A0A5S5DUR9_9FLAO|nr:head GIN domain-containing protein [Tenacibaculum adriaticum]TYP98776.1 putative autotransporter adhesin-like protein [Tenacibaculum adriaticum]